MSEENSTSADSTEIRLGKMTRRVFRRRMQAGELRACLLPLAACEQHLEHLAMEHDWRSVVTVAERVAKALKPHVIIAEALIAGVSEHHMRHPGTLSIGPGAFVAVLDDLLDGVRRAGFEHVLVLNGHGGNVEPCRAVWDQLLRRRGGNLHFLSYWDVLTEDDARELLSSGRRLPQDLPGHAQEFETSVALAAFPENVDAGAVADQPDKTPAAGTAETGEKLLDRIVPRVTEYLRDMIEGRRTASEPPYHPVIRVWRNNQTPECSGIWSNWLLWATYALGRCLAAGVFTNKT